MTVAFLPCFALLGTNPGMHIYIHTHTTNTRLLGKHATTKPTPRAKVIGSPGKWARAAGFASAPGIPLPVQVTPVVELLLEGVGRDIIVHLHHLWEVKLDKLCNQD